MICAAEQRSGGRGGAGWGVLLGSGKGASLVRSLCRRAHVRGLGERGLGERGPAAVGSAASQAKPF
jgi:hypothetical protein